MEGLTDVIKILNTENSKKSTAIVLNSSKKIISLSSSVPLGLSSNNADDKLNKPLSAGRVNAPKINSNSGPTRLLSNAISNTSKSASKQSNKRSVDDASISEISLTNKRSFSNQSRQGDGNKRQRNDHSNENTKGSQMQNNTTSSIPFIPQLNPQEMMATMMSFMMGMQQFSQNSVAGASNIPGVPLPNPNSFVNNFAPR